MMADEKKTCEQVRELLKDRAMGELAPGLTATVGKHLGVCAECRRHASELAETLRKVSAIPRIAPSEGFDAALAARLDNERSRERARRAIGVALFVAALRRVRRWGVASVVYALVLVSMGYVIGSFVGGASHDVVQAPTSEERRARPIVPADEPARSSSEAVAVIEKVAEDELVVVTGDPYTENILVPDLVWDEGQPVWVEPVSQLPEALEEPKTPKELVDLPDRPAAVELMLPAGGPGGPALARARFATIKNAKPYLRTAISSGLVWLCRNQTVSGSWTGGGPLYTDEEVTAAATLAFMESGFTASGNSRSSKCLRRGLTWLISRQGEDGMFGPGGPRQLYAQATACVAFSEALRLCDRRLVRERFEPIVNRALAALFQHQSGSGAWGSDDAELTALVLVAAGSARAAGLPVDSAPQKSALAWLDSYRRSFDSGTYASVGPGSGAGKSVSYSTIGAVLSSARPAWTEDETAAGAADELARAPVVWESGDFLRWYAGTLAAYRLNGRSWQGWRNAVLQHLIPEQAGWPSPKNNDPDHGSWEPHGICQDGGRAYSTAMSVLSLTATCGHSPVYGDAK